jgi:hypothetical protein
MVEYTITQIYRLLVEGYNPEEIKAMLNIGDRNFCKYMQKIRDREAGDYKAKQQEYHLQYL